MTYNPEYHRQYYLLNKDKFKYNPARREYNRVASAKWRRLNREASMLAAAKARAKKRGWKFNIDVSDIIIPERCPILDIPLAFTEGKQNEGTPALDRINNFKGYVKGNVQVISHKANRHKADLSVEDIERLFAYVKD